MNKDLLNLDFNSYLKYGLNIRWIYQFTST